jgi:type VI secretion system protein ImpA
MSLSNEASTLDFTALALPMSEEDAYGPNFEYTPEFLQLEAETLGKPEVQYGDTITQAIAPSWKRVMSLALPMMGRSRDLRLAVWLTRAQLNLNSIEGLAAGLGLIEALLVSCWEGLHPQLDPADDNDPLLRVNILASLCEPSGLLRDLQDAPLVSDQKGGRVSLRDFEMASGGQVDGSLLAMIDGVFGQADEGALRATEARLDKALGRIQHIEQRLTENVGIGRALDLSELATLLRRARDHFRRRLPDGIPNEPAIVDAEPGVIQQPPRGEINSRDDARQAIDRLCVYFNTHEPASPVPFLLLRAKQLIDKNFMELLQDLAPDGLAQLALVSGIRRSDD